ERLNQGQHVTRLHTLAEFFSRTTGRGIPYVDEETGEQVFFHYSPKEAAEWLRLFAERIDFVELDKKELLEGLDKAQAKSIQGGHIYDYWHALVATKAKADVLLTRNTTDFEDLVSKVEWP